MSWEDRMRRRRGEHGRDTEAVLRSHTEMLQALQEGQAEHTKISQDLAGRVGRTEVLLVRQASSLSKLEKRSEEHSATLGEHTVLLDKLEKRSEEHTVLLDKLEKRSDEHSATLKEHSETLKEHSVILEQHTVSLSRLEARTERLEAGQQELAAGQRDLLTRVGGLEARVDRLDGSVQRLEGGQQLMLQMLTVLVERD